MGDVFVFLTGLVCGSAIGACVFGWLALKFGLVHVVVSEADGYAPDEVVEAVYNFAHACGMEGEIVDDDEVIK